MAFSAIIKPSDYFIPELYTGNGGTQTISGLNFQPDFTWIKSRSNATEHSQFDSVRGATKMIASSTNELEQTVATMLTAWTSDGFSLGSYSSVNGSGYSQVSWNWKGGTTSGIATNGTTTITPTGYSFNQTNGFSAIAYTGNGVDGAYLPHGLGKSPKVMIVKRLTDAGWDWYVYHVALGNQKYMQLNTTNAISGTDGMWGSFTPDTVNMKMSNDNQIGLSGKYYIMYCFADVQGFSKMGSYTGNGNADGPFVYTGFKPAFVIMKTSSIASNDWVMFDNKRLGYNVSNDSLKPNSNSAEQTGLDIDLLSNGFKMRGTQNDFNGSGGNYIYMAFAEAPFVANSGESIPTTAR